MDAPKTKLLSAALDALAIPSSALVLLPEKNENVERSVRNLPDVKYLRAQYLNIRDLFGVAAIRFRKRIELVILLEAWKPEEEYDREFLDALAALCRSGFGDIEVHLHHDNDTAENFRDVMNRYIHLLHERQVAEDLRRIVLSVTGDHGHHLAAGPLDPVPE